MIWATANYKGGVGKSTIAVHLAVWLKEQGYSVILVDSDATASSSEWLQEADPEIKTVRLQTYEDIIAQLPVLRSEADFVIADGPAGLTEVTRAILFLADLALFPCGPCLVDLRALMKSIAVVEQVREIRNEGGLPRTIIVPTKVRRHMRLTRQLLDTLKSHNLPSGDGLSLREAYPDAANAGTLVWRLQSKGAREATAELQYFFQELLAYANSNSKTLDGGGVAAEAVTRRD